MPGVTETIVYIGPDGVGVVYRQEMLGGIQYRAKVGSKGRCFGGERAAKNWLKKQAEKRAAP